MFKNISLHGWRQFRSVDIKFHERLTVLTGANGAGKTTILNLVSRHFGWHSAFISTPKARSGNVVSDYSTDYWIPQDESIPSVDKTEIARLEPPIHVGPQFPIGAITYENGVSATLAVPTGNPGSVYDIQVQGQQGVDGLHIPSHRATYSYQAVQSIPTVPRHRAEVFNSYVGLIRARYGGSHTQWSPHYYMKESLIALATFGYGNEAVEADQESARLFSGFQDVLKRMLPPKLGFERLRVRVPDIVLETSSGHFSIDALSGGAAAVIDLAWQIYMYQPLLGGRYVVTLDEPENHLHPELQRRVLADLLVAFPTVQFVVATHSPFIVGSVANSHVYALDYDESGKVISNLLDTVNKAGSANEILRDVLGLDFTMPVWVETRLETIVDRYSDMDFSTETITALRAEMESIGLSKHIPQTIANLAERKSHV